MAFKSMNNFNPAKTKGTQTHAQNKTRPVTGFGSTPFRRRRPAHIGGALLVAEGRSILSWNYRTRAEEFEVVLNRTFLDMLYDWYILHKIGENPPKRTSKRKSVWDKLFEGEQMMVTDKLERFLRDVAVEVGFKGNVLQSRVKRDVEDVVE